MELYNTLFKKHKALYSYFSKICIECNGVTKVNPEL